MLADTVNCGSVWKDCHTAAEVRSIKDSHIAARINQFAGAKDGGVDINDCEVVKEYVESGRAEQVQHTTEGSCTNREVGRKIVKRHHPSSYVTKRRCK